MDFVALLEGLKSASPVVVLVLFLMWVINRYITYKEGERESLKAGLLRDGQEVLNINLQALASEVHGNHVEKSRADERNLAVLERIEALLLTANATKLPRCLLDKDGECPEDDSGFRMPVSAQRRMVEFQWKWCRTETLNVLLASIKKNGIAGHETVVCRRVFQSLANIAREAKYSLSRLEVVRYPYDALFDEVAPRLWEKLWDLAIPLYWKRYKCSMDQALDEFAFLAEGMFEEALSDHFLRYDDDPTTNRHVHKGEGAAPSGEWQMVNLMAEKLRAYPEIPPSRESGCTSLETRPVSSTESSGEYPAHPTTHPTDPHDPPRTPKKRKA